jgi:hypothetical protein
MLIYNEAQRSRSSMNIPGTLTSTGRIKVWGKSHHGTTR